MFSTIHFITIEGPESEAHPDVMILSIILGPVLGPIAGKICQLAAILLITVYLRRWAVYIFSAIILLYTWAAWYNINALNLGL